MNDVKQKSELDRRSGLNKKSGKDRKPEIKKRSETNDKNNINKYREKKERNKRKLKFIIFLIVVLAVIVIIANWRTIFAPLEGIWLKRGEGGFPVMLPGSTQYHVGELGDNFYLLTDTYLYTYTKDGEELAGVQHRFQNPKGVSNDKRVMVYDKNGKSFSLYSRTGEVFSNTVDDVIVLGQIGNTDRSAIVTTSTRYSNYLYVFNASGKQIFRWASPDEKIMGVCFGHNDSSIYVSVVGEQNGSLRGSIVSFDLSNSESEIWRTFIGEKITYSLNADSGGVYAVTGSGALLLDGQTGELLASNGFTRPINALPDPDGLKAVIFRDSATNKETAVTYDDKLQPTSAITPDEDISACDIDSGRLYLLIGRSLTVYDSLLNEIKRYELEDSYSNVKVIGGYAYLLGYNTVQRLEL